MAHNHPLSTPFGATGDGDSLEDALVARVALCFDDDADVQALDLTGKLTTKIVLGTSVFDYDASDTITAHNGSTVLVTADSKRFKNDGTRVNGRVPYDVDDQSLTSPPASPASGDSYLIPAAPSGDWAAFANHIAVYQNEDWTYIPPGRGMLCFVADEAGFVHYDGTAWQPGFGDYSVSAGALKADRFEQAYGWRVEAEQATPPGSIPSAGVLYIVGASATGAWSGEDGNIARSTGTGWEFETAAEGMVVFDKSRGFQIAHKTGVWQVDRLSGSIIVERPIITFPATLFANSWTTLASLGSHAVQAVGNRVKVTGAAVDFTSNTTFVQFGLFANTETAPRFSISFSTIGGGAAVSGLPFDLEYELPDVVARDYFLKALGSSVATSAISGFVTLKEVKA